MIYTLLMAQQPASGTSSTSGGIGSLLMIVAMFAILYFLMIMPQQKKQKELRKLLDSLQVNDKVVTTSGMYGRIVTIKPDKNTVILEIDDTNHVRVEIQRGAIAGLVTPENTVQS